MNDEFIKRLYSTIIEDGCSMYKRTFDNTTISSKTNEYWKNALSLYHSLDGAEKEVFLTVVKQVMIDSVSSVLGILDGSSSLNGGNLNFDVKIDGKSTDDMLQDAFLRFIEEQL